MDLWSIPSLHPCNCCLHRSPPPPIRKGSIGCKYCISKNDSDPCWGRTRSTEGPVWMCRPLNNILQAKRWILRSAWRSSLWWCWLLHHQKRFFGRLWWCGMISRMQRLVNLLCGDVDFFTIIRDSLAVCDEFFLLIESSQCVLGVKVWSVPLSLLWVYTYLILAYYFHTHIIVLLLLYCK